MAQRYEYSKHSGELTRMEEVSEAEGISIHFLAQILNELRRSHLVDSRRGKNGGYILGRPPVAITVLDIIRVMEGTTLTHEQTSDGPAAGPVNHAWQRMNSAVEAEAAKITLEDLCTGEQVPMFYI
jgi:Rrf2 family protein